LAHGIAVSIEALDDNLVMQYHMEQLKIVFPVKHYLFVLGSHLFAISATLHSKKEAKNQEGNIDIPAHLRIRYIKVFGARIRDAS
jgi:hypothetical protein